MSPRSPEQYEEIRGEKKSLIMQVALEEFAEKGFHATTINSISKRAGISKGLLYNYFKGKDDLLSEIVLKYIYEIYDYFDVNRDGHLSENEFEFFIRKMALILKEKRDFWRLMIQVLLQNEVREQFFSSVTRNANEDGPQDSHKNDFLISRIMKIFSDYFERKNDRREPGYDPELELNMFILTMKGFAFSYIFTDRDDLRFEKCLNNIIDLYK
mgnify:FL=1